jgi:hypothetical protein
MEYHTCRSHSLAAELPQHLPNNSLWFVVKEYMGDGSFVRVGTSGYIEENTIIRKSRLGELDETWQKSAGIFMLMPEDAHKLIAQLYSPPDPSAYIDQILPLGNMQTFPLEPWWEIDTVEDFEKAKQLIKTPVRLLPPDPILL